MRVGVPRETAANERRVALVPDTVAKLVKAGLEVVVERGAGEGAFHADDAYSAAGGAIVPDSTAAFGAELVVKVQRPSVAEAVRLGDGAIVVSFFQPERDPALVQTLATRRVTALSMERVPRITRAQAMDALSSQATVAGYKAVLLGASHAGRLLPMLITAAGTLAPARCLVLGAGVAGLQAIATARRLGAVVAAFDVRPAVKEQVESLGAKFLAAEVVTKDAETAGGYAKALDEEQHRRELELIHQHIRDQDLVISTALIPGRPAPVLITAEMVRDMKAGAVIVDLAAEAGGNCALTRAGELVQAGFITVLGPVNIAATVPEHASQMYSRNLHALLQHLVRDGRAVIDLSDEIIGPMVVTHQGQIRSKP